MVKYGDKYFHDGTMCHMYHEPWSEYGRVGMVSGLIFDFQFNGDG